MLAAGGTNGADTILIILNVALALAGFFGSFVLHRMQKDNENRREDIRKIFDIIAKMDRDVQDTKLESTRNFVTKDAFSESKEEINRRFDKLDEKLDNLTTLLMNNNGGHVGRARP